MNDDYIVRTYLRERDGDSVNAFYDDLGYSVVVCQPAKRLNGGLSVLHIYFPVQPWVAKPKTTTNLF